MAPISHAPIAEYLASHHVMTLATQGSDGPWAAAVFYASAEDRLIFLSSPSSRHCRNLAHDPRCAATIHENYEDWRQIKGIQLEGRVAELHGEAEVRARALYTQKFPFLGRLPSVSAALVQALARVRCYELVPSRLYFIDNSRGFGHREQIELHRQ
ncbi:MAG TPA: pyridoxamine 5'-phosphate oxidase family protein [Burkholderiaceae bacterium]|nr:pyridoxamine 5'-phosphate oxidase family protein [Burkholderiaceae bacterium]